MRKHKLRYGLKAVLVEADMAFAMACMVASVVHKQELGSLSIGH
jgi:hypothetical protein